MSQGTPKPDPRDYKWAVGLVVVALVALVLLALIAIFSQEKANRVYAFFPGMIALIALGAAYMMKPNGGGTTNLGTLETLVVIAVVSVIAIVVAYVARTWDTESDVVFARGLITVLFSTGTIALAFILALFAILGPTTSESEKSFSKGKEIFTAMIGIFGTIMGFYFGTANPNATPADAPKYSLIGPAGITSIPKGTTGFVTLKQSGKSAGVVTLKIKEDPPKGILPKLSKDTIGLNDPGDVVLSINIAEDAETKDHILTVQAFRDTAVVSSVEVKLKVTEKDKEKAKEKEKSKAALEDKE